MRNFRMQWEGHRLQFRWEIFNVPNMVNFQAVENDVDVSTAGAISGVYPGRQMQFALKYIF